MQTRDLSQMPRELAHDERLDGARALMAKLADALPPSARPLLEGDWLGHPAHPMLTDLPIGFWTSATVLDLLGGRRAAPAAKRLIGLGLLTVPMTAAAGLADWRKMPVSKQRVGVAHAVGNSAASAMYLLSWAARRRGQRIRGAMFALVGMGVATGAGLLGGHLSFGDDSPDALDLRQDAVDADGHVDTSAAEVVEQTWAEARP